ncbi:unnamed protein product [marine sediment metagenome]|uniref:Uncharacterized protein n=1 Tax=marine sediment metagenome TaxID=412755 RepID=X1R7K7_9ZZZZ
MKHKIYLIEAKEGGGWDTYDAHVVIAASMVGARRMCISGDKGQDTWLDVHRSTIKLIGITNRKKGLVLSSFNAG